MADQQASHGEIEQRINYFFELICAGYSQAQAVNVCQDNTSWGRDLSKRWLRELFQRAQAALADEVRSTDRRALLAVTHQRYERIYQSAIEDNDRRDAMAALDRITALWRLNIADAIQPDWELELQEKGHDPQAVKGRIIELLLESGEIENAG